MLVCSIDELITDFDKSVDLEDLDEFDILKNMVNIELPTCVHECQKLLIDTNNRYNRYISYITLWNNFEYIKNKIQYFLNYPENNNIIKKLNLIKEIDIELYNIVCYSHR